MIKNTYVWVPDRPDQRDYLYSAIRPVVRLPDKVDLREGCSEIERQGRDYYAMTVKETFGW